MNSVWAVSSASAGCPAHALTFGGFLLFGGRATDLLGRRHLFMAGLAIFTAASRSCALATGDTFLIIMRGIQGLGDALVLPAALSIVMNMSGDGTERNKALGIWAASACEFMTCSITRPDPGDTPDHVVAPHLWQQIASHSTAAELHKRAKLSLQRIDRTLENSPHPYTTLDHVASR